MLSFGEWIAVLGLLGALIGVWAKLRSDLSRIETKILDQAALITRLEFRMDRKADVDMVTRIKGDLDLRLDSMHQDIREIRKLLSEHIKEK